MAAPTSSLSAPRALPQQGSYPEHKAEDSSVYSPWLYGNHTARSIAYIRNSDFAKSAYLPNGEEKSGCDVVAYGIALATATVFGFCCDLIRNFLAVATIYYAGKRIWEYQNNEGPFAKPSPVTQSLASVHISVPPVASSTALPATPLYPALPSLQAGSLQPHPLVNTLVMGPTTPFQPSPLPDMTRTPYPDSTRTPYAIAPVPPRIRGT